MGVDEAGRDDPAEAVDPVVAAVVLVRLLAGADRDDLGAVDEHPAVRMLGAGVVHRHDPAVRVERPHSRGGSSSDAVTGTAADVLARADALGGSARSRIG